MPPYVLVIDEDAGRRHQIQTALNEAAYVCGLASDPTSTRQRLGENRPDAVVLNLAISGGFGVPLAEMLRMHPTSAHAPLFLMGAGAQAETATAEAALTRRFAPAALVPGDGPVGINQLLAGLLAAVPPRDGRSHDDITRRPAKRAKRAGAPSVSRPVSESTTSMTTGRTKIGPTDVKANVQATRKRGRRLGAAAMLEDVVASMEAEENAWLTPSAERTNRGDVPLPLTVTWAPDLIEIHRVAEMMAEQTPCQRLGLPPDASLDEVQERLVPLTRRYHPDRFANKSPRYRGLIGHIFNALLDAESSLSRPSPQGFPLGPPVSTARGGDGHERPGVDASGGGAGALSAIGGPLDETSGSVGAERIFQVGAESLRRRQYVVAAQAFRHVVSLCPREGRYLAALGWALFREAPGDELAEAQARWTMKLAVEGNPDRAELRASYGHLLVELGRPAEGLAQLTQAREAAPTLEGLAPEIARLQRVVHA